MEPDQNLLPPQGNPQARRCGKCGASRVERRFMEDDGQTLVYSIFYCKVCDLLPPRELMTKNEEPDE